MVMEEFSMTRVYISCFHEARKEFVEEEGEFLSPGEVNELLETGSLTIQDTSGRDLILELQVHRQEQPKAPQSETQSESETPAEQIHTDINGQRKAAWTWKYTAAGAGSAVVEASVEETPRRAAGHLDRNGKHPDNTDGYQTRGMT